MSDFEEYPKMLYRPAKGEGEMVWNERVDTLIVRSYRKEFSAIKDGWLLDPVKACALSAKMKKRSMFFAWLASHWKFWITTTIAIIAAIAAIMAIKS
jgi:hypothetical protein